MESKPNKGEGEERRPTRAPIEAQSPPEVASLDLVGLGCPYLALAGRSRVFGGWFGIGTELTSFRSWFAKWFVTMIVSHLEDSQPWWVCSHPPSPRHFKFATHLFGPGIASQRLPDSNRKKRGQHDAKNPMGPRQLAISLWKLSVPPLATYR